MSWVRSFIFLQWKLVVGRWIVRNMQVEGKKALVLGAGRSGVASAEFLSKHGAIVALHDSKADRNVD